MYSCVQLELYYLILRSKSRVLRQTDRWRRVDAQFFLVAKTALSAVLRGQSYLATVNGLSSLSPSRWKLCPRTARLWNITVLWFTARKLLINQLILSYFRLLDRIVCKHCGHQLKTVLIVHWNIWNCLCKRILLTESCIRLWNENKTVCWARDLSEFFRLITFSSPRLRHFILITSFNGVYLPSPSP